MASRVSQILSFVGFAILLIPLVSWPLSAQTFIIKPGSREGITVQPGQPPVQALREYHERMWDSIEIESLDSSSMRRAHSVLSEDEFELRWYDGYGSGNRYTFGFNTGDSMAHWMVPLSSCKIKKILIYNFDFTGRFEMFLRSSSYDGEIISESCADANGWVGLWQEDGTWLPGENECFTDPPLGEELWPKEEEGGWIVEMDSSTHETWLEVDLGEMGYPEIISTPFFITAAVKKTDPDSWGIGAWDRIQEPHHGFKYYHPERDWTPSGQPGWHVRSFGWDVYALVEYFGDVPPIIAGVSPVYDTYSTDSKEVRATIWDWNPSGGPSGVAKAWVHFSANPEQDSVQMTLIGDSLYSGIIPGFEPGTEVNFKVKALDIEGNWNSSMQSSYRILPMAPILVHWNVGGGSCGEVDSYFQGLKGSLQYDCCSESGSLHDSCYPVYEYYETVVVLSTWEPWVCLDDFFTPDALRDWLESGNKNYLLAGDKWLDQCFGTLGDTIRNFVSGEIPYDYLGLDGYYRNINYIESGDVQGVSRLLPIKNDVISNAMYEFLGDSLRLNYDPNHEVGSHNRLDGLFPVEGAKVSYWGLSGVLDSTLSPSQDAETLATGVYHQSPNNNKSAFFAFDVLGLNTMAVGADSLYGAGYHWVGTYPQGPISQALLWMNAIILETEIEKTLPADFALLRTYPNPFNPTTTIEFSVPRSGLVTMTVYDILGRKAKTILNQHTDAGQHKIQWNANNVPSGIYFVRMEAGQGFSQVRKVTVLK